MVIQDRTWGSRKKKQWNDRLPNLPFYVQFTIVPHLRSPFNLRHDRLNLIPDSASALPREVARYAGLSRGKMGK